MRLSSPRTSALLSKDFSARSSQALAERTRSACSLSDFAILHKLLSQHVYKILKKKASANGEIKKKAALYLENTSIFSYFLRFIPYLLLLVVVNKTAQHPPHAADAPFLQPVHIRQADR